MEKYYVAAINAVNLLGAQRTRKLIEFFGGAENAWRAEPELLKQVLSPKALESFIDFRQKNPAAPEILQEFCVNKNIGLCSISDADYPTLLKEIDSPPPVFYYKGKLQPDAERIAIVGTRRNTAYGERVTRKISGELAEAGFTIVSGAAYGIDTCAHQGAMKFGRTVAVLGYGISKIPREKKFLTDQIAENGVVMTEFSPGMNANIGTFPTRNRIIAGLSRGVVVVEAGKKSGALITSSYAGDFSRDVFAVPGSIFFEKSYGCHELIRDGAILVKNAQDILDFYNMATKKNSAEFEISADEKKVFDLIPADDYITLDEILEELNDVELPEIQRIIVELELKKCVAECAGGYTKT